MPEENKNKLLMPGEWEPHSATWLAWPNDDDYFGDKIKKIESIFIKIIQALAKGETVKLLVLDQQKEDEVRKLLQQEEINLERIIFYQTKYVDVWIRDYGPTFVAKNEKKAWVKWNYDGYGGKFPELFPDNDVFNNLKDKIEGEKIRAEVSMEGGAIESNGWGVIMTTEECLMWNRNRGQMKEENELMLEKYLGAEKIIWLNKGLMNDHTDGHIDEVARFVSPTKIICAFEEDTSEENYERLKENYDILTKATDQRGNKFEVVKLPMPHLVYDEGDKEFNGKKAPVSYANFYIGNEAVLVSVFDDPNDNRAVEIIRSCFPDKEVVPINCRDLIYGGGAIHCITQQEPA